jgi:hypothetical protein
VSGFILAAILRAAGSAIRAQSVPTSHVDNFSEPPRAVIIIDIGDEPGDQMSLVRLPFQQV